MNHEQFPLWILIGLTFPMIEAANVVTDIKSMKVSRE